MATKKYCSLCDFQVHGNSKTCPNCESTIFMYQDEELHVAKTIPKDSWKKITNGASDEPLESAGLLKRIGAAMIDGLIGLPIGVIVLMIIPELTDDWLLSRLVLIAPIVVIKSYSQTSNGLSIGQKVFRIGLERPWSLDPTQISLRNFIAFALLAIPGLNLLNILVIIFNKQGKGLHDLLTGTRMIKWI